MKRNPMAGLSVGPARLLAGVGVMFGMYGNVKATGQPALEAPFTRITNSPVGVDASMWTAPVWIDYDNDGWLDLFVATFTAGGRNALFRNDGDGKFIKVTTGPLVTEGSPQIFGAAGADYDNDGWPDLVVSSNNRNLQPCRLYRNTGGGGFVRMTGAEVGPVATDASHAFGVSWADYDRDGHLDLFVANGASDLLQPDFLFHNERNGRFVRVSNAVTTAALATAHGSWADADNDGLLDLLVVQHYTSNEFYRTDALARFEDASAKSGLDDTGSVSFGAAWGDYDNDGDLDLVIINMGWGGPVVRNWLYRNGGDGTFEPVTTGLIAEDEDHFTSGSWVDYDNDGWLDLFVTVLGPSSNAGGGVFNRLYRNQGDGTFALATTGSLVTQGGNPGSAAWGDFNNDGFPDVVVTAGNIFSPQRNALYRNNGNANNWIKLRCVGTDSNRSAIGAKVRVKATIQGVERWQMRQIGCHQDWIACHSLDTVIGLGDAPVVDTLRIEWPSGRVQEWHGVPARQSLTMVERTDLAASLGASGEVSLAIQGPRQQRYRVEASGDLKAWSQIGSVTITNENGTASFQPPPADGETRKFFRVQAE